MLAMATKVVSDYGKVLGHEEQKIGAGFITQKVARARM